MLKIILILVYILSLNAQEKDYDFRCKQDGQVAPKWTCVPMIEDMYADVGLGEDVNEAYLNAVCNLKRQLDAIAKSKNSTFKKFKKVKMDTKISHHSNSCNIVGIDRVTAKTKYLYDKKGLIEKKLDLPKNFYKIETSFAMSSVYKIEVWQGKKNTFVLVEYPEKEFDKNLQKNPLETKKDKASWQ